MTKRLETGYWGSPVYLIAVRKLTHFINYLCNL